MKSETRPISRRGFFKTSMALAAGAAGQRPQNVEDAGTLERIWRHNAAPNQSMLLKGGTIVSMDPKVGDFVKGDVLIQGKKIAAVAGELKAPPQAQVIDASNTIVIPGFIDAHRHSWEGQLRRIIPNGAINAYMATTHQGFARYYRPHDMYVGNLITALGCIDAGITCIIDNSHNSRSSAHSDAAIQALLDSGIRGVHASGAPQNGDWDKQWPQDLARIQKQFFASDDQLVTLRMFSGLSRENFALARRLGIRITTESNGGAQVMTEFWNEKLLGQDNTYNHCNGWSDAVWQQVRDSGGTVNVCPRSDPQYGLGEGIPAFQKALDHGMRPAFSIDNETSYGTDMFTEMRVAFNIQRAMATYRKANGDTNAPPIVSVRDVLECATVSGAANAGLLGKCGTLTPGKEADIILLRTDRLNVMPMNNAVGAVVTSMNSSNVDTVLIAGKVMKRAGALVGVDFARLTRLGNEARERLFSNAKVPPSRV